MSSEEMRAAVILLVEDNPADQEITFRAFEKGRIKNDLRIVENGEDAIDYLNGEGQYKDNIDNPTPDLILLDLNLPGISGFDVLQKIRSISKFSAIPIIVLTTSKRDEDILESYMHGCNSFIRKPVDIEKFISIIQEINNYWFQVVILPPK